METLGEILCIQIKTMEASIFEGFLIPRRTIVLAFPVRLLVMVTFFELILVM
jgi:hypothetical protein